ncbi:hypothetical protein VitviT2T_005162 [Vitis vinifera]|uniref:Uncharacterized protein n=1 Tax=Vitis vinifera TaxID=29760 RepID=A0ABY9BTR0_VITVI|nr:hypothetical protein VitviT2T_005162 [Vitis vinifera]
MTNENGSFSRLAANASSISIHPSLPASKAQDVESIPFHGLGEKVTISGDDFTASAHTLLTAPIDVPSREELDVLLEHPQQNFMARVPHGASRETIEAIIRLKDYSTMQTAEICQLKLDLAAIESSKAKVEEESAQLKRKLEQTMFSFAKENELEAAYQH